MSKTIVFEETKHMFKVESSPCVKCGASLRPHWLKDGMCNGCRNPQAVIPALITKRFYIQDWAGNRLWEHGTFEFFEDAWGYIYETFEDADFDDLFVIERRSK